MKKIVFIFLTVCFSTLWVNSQTNPICNPGFESGYNVDWSNNTNSGAVAYSDETTDVYSGSIALSAEVNTADDWRNYIKSCAFDLTAGHSYKFSFMAKTVSGSIKEIKVKIIGPNLVDNFVVPDDNWNQIVYNFTADANYSGATVRISFRDVETYIIDDVVLGDVTTIDCNGDINGTAYIDNCDQCVGGNTGVTSTCTVIGTTGNIKTLNEPYFGLNVKSLRDANFQSDINVLEAWKKTNATIYRYPGGTYGNSFNWHTGTTVVGGRPGDFDPPITPTDIATKLPDDTEILWMANVRIPMPETGYDWRILTRAELLSEPVLQAKTQDVLDGLDAFAAAGKPVKYLELGNEFYFSAEEGLNEPHGAGGDGGDYQGDHFPYDDNPVDYINDMAVIAKAVKQAYPDIQIAVIKCKSEATIKGVTWNAVIDDAFQNNSDVATYVDAVISHWYQQEIYYDGQTQISPTISDDASSKTAIGYAYDYIDYKKEFDVQQIPAGKELWVTEGDLHDPSEDWTWLEGIREGVVQLNYVMLDHITMHTPQLFQPYYVSDVTLKLTAKGKVASMIHAAGKGMNTLEELDLGGGYFSGEWGGPYPELQGVKFSDGSGNERFILINCANNTHSNLDMSNLINASNLKLYQRSSTTPWAGESADETITDVVSNSITLAPYSATILAEQSIIDELVEHDFIVSNPTGTYPDRYIALYEFGSDLTAGQTYTQNLAVKNDGSETLTLATDPISLVNGASFSVTQPSNLTINAGSTSGFSVSFTPLTSGDFEETMLVTAADGRVLKVTLTGNAMGEADPPVLTTITITPGSATIDEGQSVQFSAEALDQYGSPYATTFTWSTTAGTSIDQTGLFTSSTGGTYTVTASAEGVDGNATAQVNVPPVSPIANPSFELGYNVSWSLLVSGRANASFESSSDAVTGSVANMITVSKADQHDNVALVSDAISMDLTNKTIDASCYIKASGSRQDMKLQIVFYDQQGNPSSFTSSTMSVTGSYQQFMFSAEAPAGSVSFEVQVLVGKKASVYYVDDVYATVYTTGTKSSISSEAMPTEITDNILVYPNPANNAVTITGAEIASAILFAVDGKSISVDIRNNQFNVSSLPAGMYILKGITTEGRLVKTKLFIH